MQNLLKDYIKLCLEQTARIQKGDAAQKRIAAWFVLLPKKNFTASVNTPGSRASDVLINGKISIESKNNESGDMMVYSQELMSGSAIATALTFAPGVTSSGLSIDRFKPAQGGEPLDIAQAEKVRQFQDLKIDKALQTSSDTYQALFGGKSSARISPSRPPLTQSEFINTLRVDGTIVTRFGTTLRPAVILLAPGKANDASRLRFWNEGSSRIRAATGGKGKQTLGSVVRPEASVLTQAWRQDYAGSDDYFAIVSGQKMYIGYINSDPLDIGVPQLSVELHSDNVMTYGGTKVSGIREKVLLKLIGGKTVELPSDLTVNMLEQQGLITVRK